MLTYEALINEAKERGMPAGKMLGILREYLQVIILKELYRLPRGKEFYFTGGTYLRLAHLTKRFSEDLDFNSNSLNRHDFEDALHTIAGALMKEGFSAAVAFGHWENILVAELVFPDVEKSYGVMSKHSKKEGILIKVEVNRPAWKVIPETLIVSGFGQMYPVICTQRGALFADKIDALVKKNRARHLFDIIFMLAHAYPIEGKVLKTLGIAGSPLDVIRKRVERFSAAELRKYAEDLRPFLFDESEAELLANAKTVVPQLLDRYKHE